MKLREYNPWELITLSDYENHMSLDSVKQLQALNSMMKEQFKAYPVDTVMILGVAGGNGLEHIDTGKYRKVYGIDINDEYLKAVPERYSDLSGVLECFRIDLMTETDNLPQAKLVIANLLIEYIGYTAFQNAVRQSEPEYVSCIIQINADEEMWVSDSPYLYAFDGLERVHHQMEEEALKEAMNEIGYLETMKKSEPLPNGKTLLRLDYSRTISEEL